MTHTDQLRRHGAEMRPSRVVAFDICHHIQPDGAPSVGFLELVADPVVVWHVVVRGELRETEDRVGAVEGGDVRFVADRAAGKGRLERWSKESGGGGGCGIWKRGWGRGRG